MKNILGRKTGNVILILQNRNLKGDLQLTNIDGIIGLLCLGDPVSIGGNSSNCTVERTLFLIGGISVAKEENRSIYCLKENENPRQHF